MDRAPKYARDSLATDSNLGQANIIVVAPSATSTYPAERSTRGFYRHHTSCRNSILFPDSPLLLFPHIHNLYVQTGRFGTYHKRAL